MTIKLITRALVATAATAVLSLTATACSHDDHKVPDTNNAALGVVKAMQESGTPDIDGSFTSTDKPATLPSGVKGLAHDTSQQSASWKSKSTGTRSIVEKHSNATVARAAVFSNAQNDGHIGAPKEYAYYNGPWVLRLNGKLPYDLAQDYVAQFNANTGTFEQNLPRVLPGEKTCRPLYDALHELTLNKQGSSNVGRVLAHAYELHLAESTGKLDSVSKQLLDLRSLATATYLSNTNGAFTDKPQQEFAANAKSFMYANCATALGNSMAFAITTTTTAG